MSEYLDPTGRSSYGIAVCARCNQKFFLDELTPDPNSPGLYVCRADRDQFDPYRLPARQTENIALEFTRPDVPLTGERPPTLLALATQSSVNEILTTEDGLVLLVEGIEP